jgi:Uma2 family endonuclease
MRLTETDQRCFVLDRRTTVYLVNLLETAQDALRWQSIFCRYVSKWHPAQAQKGYAFFGNTWSPAGNSLAGEGESDIRMKDLPVQNWQQRKALSPNLLPESLVKDSEKAADEKKTLTLAAN